MRHRHPFRRPAVVLTLIAALAAFLLPAPAAAGVLDHAAGTAGRAELDPDGATVPGARAEIDPDGATVPGSRAEIDPDGAP